MTKYTTPQILKIFNSCKTATELLEMKTTLQETQILPFVATLVFDLKMENFLKENVI